MDLGDAQVLMDFVNNDEVQRGGPGGLLGDCLDDLNEGGYATGPVMGATGALGMQSFDQAIEDYHDFMKSQ